MLHFAIRRSSSFRHRQHFVIIDPSLRYGRYPPMKKDFGLTPKSFIIYPNLKSQIQPRTQAETAYIGIVLGIKGRILRFF